jgi:hypothetical protein
MPLVTPLVRALGAALSTALVLTLAVSVSSASATPLLSCPLGTGSGTYSPALTNTPQPVSITFAANYGTCIGSSGVRTGSSGKTIPPAPRSCTNLLGSSMGVPRMISWSTGTTSTMLVDTYPQYLTGGRSRSRASETSPPVTSPAATSSSSSEPTRWPAPPPASSPPTASPP